MRERIVCLVVAALCAQSAAAADAQRIDAKSPTGKGSYKIESTLSIGGPNAAEEAQFYERAGRTEVGADAKGNIYVLDSGGPRVQVFDPQGRFVRSLGKKGEGPGEMKMPAVLAVASDGRFAIFDMGLQRISVYDQNGKLLRDQLTPGPVQDLLWDDRGRLVVAMRSPDGDATEAFDASGKSVWVYRPKGAAPAPGGRRIVLEIGNETVGSRLALASNGDVFSGSRDSYEVQRLENGRVAETWSRAYERQARRPLPQPREGDGEGEGGAVMIVRRTNDGGAGGGQTSVTTSHDGEERTTLSMDELQKMLPKHSADIRGLIGWKDGRLWVLTSTDEGDNMVVDEWTSRGEYAKRFALPGQYSSLRMGSDGQLYGIAHDREEYVMVQRLDVTPIVP
jgi:hypothetical protein